MSSDIPKRAARARPASVVSTVAKQRAPRPRAGSITARDVARMAGVSVATVSRTLNGNPKVDLKMRAAVLKIARDNGYTPHAAAKALATQHSSTIAAVVPTLEPPFSIGVAALQSRMNQAGYTLLLASSNYDEQEELRQVRALCAHGIGGMMLVGARHDAGVYETLRSRGVPFVNCWVLAAEEPCVGFDNREIGRTLANYLLGLGHRRIGMISQRSKDSDRAAERIAGVREAIAARGVAAPSEYHIERTHKIIDGQMALRSLVAAKPRPTAIICGTDNLAYGAMIEAEAIGLRVPQHLSITGIGDVEFAAHLVPPLTTVRLAVEDMGLRAAEYLLGRMAGTPVAESTALPFNLIVRGSTGPPPR